MLSKDAVKKIMLDKYGQQRHLVMKPGILLTDELLNSMQTYELKMELKARKLHVSGTKDMLKDRIKDSFASQGKVSICADHL